MQYRDQSDKALLEAFRNGKSQEALGHLYVRYMELTYGVCLKYLKRPESAQDAVMDIYEHIEMKLRTQEVQSFSSWLYKVCVNHCLQVLRKEKSGKIIPIDEAVTKQNEPGEIEEFELAESADQLVRLELCLEKLPDEQKRCLRHFYYDKWSYAEISEKTMIKPELVRSYIQNGRRNLKICLDKYQNGGGTI